MLEAYLSIFIKAVFIENIAINFFLGMCTFLAISKRIQPAIGLGNCCYCCIRACSANK